MVVNLNGAVKTRAALTIQSELDENHYETGCRVTDEQVKGLSIERPAFRGEWDYALAPKP